MASRLAAIKRSSIRRDSLSSKSERVSFAAPDDGLEGRLKDDLMRTQGSASTTNQNSGRTQDSSTSKNSEAMHASSQSAKDVNLQSALNQIQDYNQGLSTEIWNKKVVLSCGRPESSIF